MAVKFGSGASRSTPVYFTTQKDWSTLARSLPNEAASYAELAGFAARTGEHVLAPSGISKGQGASLVVFALAESGSAANDAFAAGKLVNLLPAGNYAFANEPPGGTPALAQAALGWLLAQYAFDRYRKPAQSKPMLAAPAGVDAARIQRLASAICLTRDLINTPANDMGPQALEKAALAIAKKYRARARVVRGDALLRQNFPLIHAVGRAGPQAPRLVDFVWGPANAPKITLVGKGVCFDTGGLDIKPSAAMLMMKKDMAGAATALGLAQAIMDAKLPVRLRVLLPIVENSVSSDSFRPGDVYRARNGVSVEIGNTDAEGRLVLADAMALAGDEAPDMMFDFATLTGAARVAMGPDLPPFYCTDDALANDIARTGMACADPVWRLPLWEPYTAMLASKIADTNNVSSGPFAGSITAALFLKKFIGKAKAWAHFDIYAWNPSTKPGRPEGGEAQTLRLLYELLEEKFAKKRAPVARRRT